MLRSIKQLFGNTLGASDGEIGRIKDFYFDDQDWTIRYLAVDTGEWLSGRQVLLTPHSLGMLDQPEKILRVNLTRKQIEDSPSIESHKPISRQYEENYHHYYGWTGYWQAARRANPAGEPIHSAAAKGDPGVPIANPGLRSESDDAHLCSVRAVTGYQLQTSDGIIGHVVDFMMDAQSWAIGQLVIKTGDRFSGEEVLIEMKNVERISYEESTVFGSLTAKPVEHVVATPG